MNHLYMFLGFESIKTLDKSTAFKYSPENLQTVPKQGKYQKLLTFNKFLDN